MADPSDLKFSTDAMKLVDYYLRNRVSTGKSDFITDINLYEEEPWLLPHVNHVQFNDKEWFYFVTRTRRAGKTARRTVRGRGGSVCGTWTTTGKQKKILDNNKIVIGYKSELSYRKKINGKKKEITTGWCMTEYSLASTGNDDLFQEVVLCRIRENKGVVEQFRFHPEINNNNVVEQPPQLENIDNNNININVSDVIVPGVDSAIGLQNDEDYRRIFDDCWIDLDLFYACLNDLVDQQEPAILPPLQDQEIDQEMEEYADKLENMLQVEVDVDDDEAAQQQQHAAQIPLLPELGQDSRNRNNGVVIMEDECVDQDWFFDLLDDQEKGVVQPQHFEEIARDEEMNPTVSKNPYGYHQMQEAAINNQDASCSSATTRKQGRKRRRVFEC